MNSKNTRRAFIQESAAIGTGLFLSACGRSNSAQAGKRAGESASKKDEKEEGGEVTATEDLMREHGVLRRALLVYTAAANRLRANPASVPTDTRRMSKPGAAFLGGSKPRAGVSLLLVYNGGVWHPAHPSRVKIFSPACAFSS